MKRLTSFLLLVFLHSWLAPFQARAAGMIAIDPVNQTIASHIELPPKAAIPPAEPAKPNAKAPIKIGVSYGLHLKSQKVQVEMHEQVTKTHLTQVFANETDADVAGTYLFPLPKDTAFNSFSLTIDGKPVEGKILEADQARQQYIDIVRRSVDPGLLEFASCRTVRARIYPIPARGTKTVELEYTQILHADSGMLSYSFPLRTVGQSGPVDSVEIDVTLQSKEGVRTIWSPTHKVSITKTDNHRARVSYAERNVVPDKDFAMYYNISNQDLSANLLTCKPEKKGEDGYFLLTVTPPIDASEIAAKDVVFVIDTSGSMAGIKIKQAKQALLRILSELNSSDRFDIVSFNSNVENFKPKLVAATKENREEASSFVNNMRADGATFLSGGITSAVDKVDSTAGRPSFFVLLTDGEPTKGICDIPELTQLIPKSNDVRLFDVGIGYEVNSTLLNKLAEEHHGTTEFIEHDEEVETSVAALYRRIKSPVLTDVTFKISNVATHKLYPRIVKDIFSGSQVMLMGRFIGSGKAEVSITGKLNGQTKNYAFPASFDNTATHDYLPRLWAMRRIGYLCDVSRENGEQQETIQEIVELSKRFGIVTPYTSFLALDPAETRYHNRNWRQQSGSSNSRPPDNGVYRHMTGTHVQYSPVIDTTGTNQVSPRRAQVIMNMPVPSVSPTAAQGTSAASPVNQCYTSADVDFGPYLSNLQRRAKQQWFPPKGNESKPVTVAFRIHPDGSVSNIHIVKSSGIGISDAAAIKAIKQAAPFRPLPPGAPSPCDIEFKFDYNVFSGPSSSFSGTQSGSNRAAIKSLKAILDLKASTMIGTKSETDSKTIADKTFTLKDEFWTDESFVPGKSPTPEVIKFGSTRYFDLITAEPELAKFLAIGKQLIIIYKEHCYKITNP